MATQERPDAWPHLAVVDGKLVRGRFLGHNFQAMPSGTEAEDARELARDIQAGSAADSA